MAGDSLDISIMQLWTAQQGNQGYASGERRAAAAAQQIIDGICRGAGTLQPPNFGIYSCIWPAQLRIENRYQSDAVADGAQTRIGIILPQQQPVFAAGRSSYGMAHWSPSSPDRRSGCRI